MNSWQLPSANNRNLGRSKFVSTAFPGESVGLPGGAPVAGQILLGFVNVLHIELDPNSGLVGMEQPTEQSERDASGRSPWRRALMVGVNVWLIVHLFAIVIAPATVGPSSRTAQRGWEAVSAYLEGLFLNHGFHYFAPEPGSSTLVSYTLNFDDGTTKDGRFPNRDITPRLNYHRHFMLSEFLGSSSPDVQQVLIRGYAQNLVREHGAESVTLSMIRHNLPFMERIRAGGNLDDSDLYEEEPLGTFRWDELQQN